MTKGGRKDKSANAGGNTNGPKDDSAEGENRSNPFSKRTRPTYIKPSARNTPPSKNTVYLMEKIQYKIENQIEDIETTIQTLA